MGKHVERVVELLGKRVMYNSTSDQNMSCHIIAYYSVRVGVCTAQPELQVLGS